MALYTVKWVAPGMNIPRYCPKGSPFRDGWVSTTSQAATMPERKANCLAKRLAAQCGDTFIVLKVEE